MHRSAPRLLLTSTCSDERRCKRSSEVDSHISLAAEDAGSVGKDVIRALFRAAVEGAGHPMLQAAHAKMERMRGP